MKERGRKGGETEGLEETEGEKRKGKRKGVAEGRTERGRKG